MSPIAFAFWFFSAVTLLSGLIVVTARNPVHAVLFLILAFFSSAGLFLLIGAEFIAMILVIVYVGAVAVLFLFVVMMLDIDFEALRAGLSSRFPMGALVGGLLVIEIFIAIGVWSGLSGSQSVQFGASNSSSKNNLTNTEALGQVLYTDYAYLFQGAGLILLVAMIGAISLTLRHRAGVRRQNIMKQSNIELSDVMEIRRSKPLNKDSGKNT